MIDTLCFWNGSSFSLNGVNIDIAKRRKETWKVQHVRISAAGTRTKSDISDWKLLQLEKDDVTRVHVLHERINREVIT